MNKVTDKSDIVHRNRQLIRSIYEGRKDEIEELASTAYSEQRDLSAFTALAELLCRPLIIRDPKDR